MNLTPLLESTAVIQLHTITAVFALVLGGIILVIRKGTNTHKILGLFWVLAMVIVALSAFGIHEIQLVGIFSPIHLLSILVLLALGRAIYVVRAGNIKKHQSIMKQLYFGGLILPGLFTLMPDRLLNEVFIEPLARRIFFAGDRLSIFDQIIIKAPVCVWPLLVLLIMIGLLHTRQYSMPKWRMFILPITFSIAAIIASISMTQPILSIIVTIAACVSIIPIGVWLAKSSGAYLTEASRIEIPGEWVTLVLLLSIFANRFVSGVVTSASPEIANGVAFTVTQAFISGAIIGIAAGRTIHYNKLFAAKNRSAIAV